MTASRLTALCSRACSQQMLGSIPSAALSGGPMGCGCFLARGSDAAKRHGRAVRVFKPSGYSAAQLCDGREGDKAQRWAGSPLQAVSVVDSETLGTGGGRAGRSCWRRWPEHREANATAFTPCSLGMLAAKCRMDPGEQGLSQALQALLWGAEGKVPGPAGSPAGCRGGATRLGWQQLALTLVCMKTTRWH